MTNMKSQKNIYIYCTLLFDWFLATWRSWCN